jgi:hypothetical protein
MSFFGDEFLEFLSIEVINIGFVPVSVTRVVLPTDSQNELHFNQNPHFKVELPIRLEPRASVTLMTTPELQLAPEFKSVLRARASTACGRHFDGNSPALKSMIKKARS